jgi:DNA-binding response OmpR family regulator
VKQCAVLIINGRDQQTTLAQEFERRGFRAVETRQWPEDDVVQGHEVVIVVLRHVNTMCMLAARLRAKRGFGQRVLIAVSPTIPDSSDLRDGLVSGFDDVLAESCGARTLLARVLQRLRSRPQYRCILPDRKRPAA